jgi:membrane-associated HD superfamily phosphohydrolase
MPRSGSELLQCILHQNPRIYASTTSPVLEYIFAIRQNFDLPEVKSQDPALMKEAFLEVCETFHCCSVHSVNVLNVLCKDVGVVR